MKGKKYFKKNPIILSKKLIKNIRKFSFKKANKNILYH